MSAGARSTPTAARVSPPGALAKFRAWREQHAYSLVSSLGRFFQRPFATLLTVGVMAVAIALPLALGIALANLQRLSGSLQSSREVAAFLLVDVDATQAERLATSLDDRYRLGWVSAYLTACYCNDSQPAEAETARPDFGDT